MAEDNGIKETMLDTSDQVYVADERFVRLYANNIQFSMSLWDANLTFGEIIGEQNGKTVVLQKVKVNMSKELAKVLMFILEKNIGFYEAKAGAITLPLVEIGEPTVETPKKARKATKKRVK